MLPDACLIRKNTSSCGIIMCIYVWLMCQRVRMGRRDASRRCIHTYRIELLQALDRVDHIHHNRHHLCVLLVGPG